MLNKNIEQVENNYYKFSRPEMIKYVPINSRTVLDIGCSEGNFGRLLKETINCEVYGIELNRNIAIKASKVLYDVFLGDAEKNIEHIYSNTDLKFDCIVFNDSLEHFTYPINILNTCKKILSDNGTIVASIPNVRYLPVLKDLLFNKNWEYKDSGILDNTHMRFFTENSIKTLFNNCGYEIITIDGINKHDSLIDDAKYLGMELATDLSDTVYLQFAVVAKIKENNGENI